MRPLLRRFTAVSRSTRKSSRETAMKFCIRLCDRNHPDLLLREVMMTIAGDSVPSCPHTMPQASGSASSLALFQLLERCFSHNAPCLRFLTVRPGGPARPSARISAGNVRPCRTNVTRMTLNVKKIIRLRCGNGLPSARCSGNDSAAASAITPAHPGPARHKNLPRRWTWFMLV